jgi:hypothetical protein
MHLSRGVVVDHAARDTSAAHCLLCGRASSPGLVAPSPCMALLVRCRCVLREDGSTCVRRRGAVWRVRLLRSSISSAVGRGGHASFESGHASCSHGMCRSGPWVRSCQIRSFFHRTIFFIGSIRWFHHPFTAALARLRFLEIRSLSKFYSLVYSTQIASRDPRSCARHGLGA